LIYLFVVAVQLNIKIKIKQD